MNCRLVCPCTHTHTTHTHACTNTILRRHSQTHTHTDPHTHMPRQKALLPILFFIHLPQFLPEAHTRKSSYKRNIVRFNFAACCQYFICCIQMDSVLTVFATGSEYVISINVTNQNCFYTATTLQEIGKLALFNI